MAIYGQRSREEVRAWKVCPNCGKSIKLKNWWGLKDNNRYLIGLSTHPSVGLDKMHIYWERLSKYVSLSCLPEPENIEIRRVRVNTTQIYRHPVEGAYIYAGLVIGIVAGIILMCLIK